MGEIDMSQYVTVSSVEPCVTVTSKDGGVLAEQDGKERWGATHREAVENVRRANGYLPPLEDVMIDAQEAADPAAVEKCQGSTGCSTEPSVDVLYSPPGDLFSAEQEGIRRWAKTQDEAIREVRRANGYVGDDDGTESVSYMEVDAFNRFRKTWCEDTMNRLRVLETALLGSNAIANDFPATGHSVRQETPERYTVQDMLKSRADVLRRNADNLDRLAARLPMFDAEDGGALCNIVEFGLNRPI